VPTTKECKTKLPELEWEHVSPTKRIEEISKFWLTDDTESEGLDSGVGLGVVPANFDMKLPAWGR